MTDLPESPAPRSTSEIASFHAHIYYDPASTRLEAERLRTWIDERFSVTLGRWHDAKVGPHDQAMFQVAFATEIFPVLVPWLMLNHGRLSILVMLDGRLPAFSSAMMSGERPAFAANGACVIRTPQIRAGIILQTRSGSDRHLPCTGRSCRRRPLWSRRLHRIPGSRP